MFVIASYVFVSSQKMAFTTEKRFSWKQWNFHGCRIWKFLIICNIYVSGNYTAQFQTVMNVNLRLYINNFGVVYFWRC